MLYSSKFIVYCSIFEHICHRLRKIITKMPRKDNSQYGRQRKKDSKKNGGKQIYSSKHIRIHEAIQQKNNLKPEQTDKNKK